MEQYEKKGYLNSEFRLFHLTDQETKEVDYHYHDFDKITIFIRGKVNYMIEGRSYDLKPYDIVLVKQGDIHRLTVDNSCPYERIIVYISPNFMNAYQTDNYDLSYCFQKAAKEHSNVLRIPSFEKSSLFRSISQLEHSFTDGGYASELYRQVMFLEFMIHLNRAVRKNRLEYIDTDNCNEKVFGRTLYPVTCVSIGNPHCVIPMREISKPLVCKIGDYSEIARYFPNRINTQIMQVIDKENIAIEIFERGAGYTRASGTGACAAAGVAYKLGLTNSKVIVHMPGGELQVEVEDDWNVYMTGDVFYIAKVTLSNEFAERLRAL